MNEELISRRKTLFLLGLGLPALIVAGTILPLQMPRPSRAVHNQLASRLLRRSDRQGRRAPSQLRRLVSLVCKPVRNGVRRDAPAG